VAVCRHYPPTTALKMSDERLGWGSIPISKQLHRRAGDRRSTWRAEYGKMMFIRRRRAGNRGQAKLLDSQAGLQGLTRTLAISWGRSTST